MTTSKNSPTRAMVLQHYERFLGRWARTWIFHGPNNSHEIHVHRYRNVHEGGYDLFATTGVSDESPHHGGELVLIARELLDDVPQLLGRLGVYYRIRRAVPQRGQLIDIATIDPAFARVCGKRGVYTAVPYSLPAEFGYVKAGSSVVHVVMVFPVTTQEMRLFQEGGAKRLEEHFFAIDVDAMDLLREDGQGRAGLR